MEETIASGDLLVTTKKNLLAYLETLDVKYLTENAVYRNLATGQVHQGRTEISAMLHYVYHVAFDARIEKSNFIITESKALMEGFFKGKHIGEFNGIPATNKAVNVPISVSYDLENGLIREARIYMLTDIMEQQLGVSAQTISQKQKTTYLIRDIFHLKFGRFREAKMLLEKASENKLMPAAKQMRVLSDFTGDSYRLIFEEGFDSLTDYELSLSSSMNTEEWQKWYELFKPNVERSHREILKQVM
ncbi:MAG: ester cyclase [Flavisolibacter sp.]|jgi:predicted ester cyclase